MINEENDHFSILNEGSTKFFIYSRDNNAIPSKSMAVFYNKKMELNSDISNLAILAYNKLLNPDSLVIVDSMAGSGVSSIRMLKEFENIKKIYINDINPIAVKIIQKNQHWEGPIYDYIFKKQINKIIKHNKEKI